MKYKALICDVDGTTVQYGTYGSEPEPTPRVVNALRKASEKIHVCLASGRSYYRLQDLIKKIDMEGLVIANDGAIVSDLKTGEMLYEKGMLGYIYIPGINENAYFDKDGFVVETSSDTVPGVPCIDGISCDKVVLYEKLPIKQTMLKDILELTQGLKRQDLVPDSVDYGAQNAPVAKYGNVSVIIGDTTKLTRKIERLKAIMPSLEGQSGTLHLESWTEETTNIVFDKSE